MRSLVILSTLWLASVANAQWGGRSTVQFGSSCAPSPASFTILPPQQQTIVWQPPVQTVVVQQAPVVIPPVYFFSPRVNPAPRVIERRYGPFGRLRQERITN